MNSDPLRAILLLAAMLFLAGCKDNPPAPVPQPSPSPEQTVEVTEEVEGDFEEEIPDEEIASEQPPAVPEAHLYAPRPIPDLRQIYGP